MAPKSKIDFRDVNNILKIIRNFLLGRKHTLHVRFPSNISPRTIPPPEVPRSPCSPCEKYSDMTYFNRSYMDSVKPPVVAPVATGPGCYSTPLRPQGEGDPMKPNEVYFACAPTPGAPWWWDGHCYAEHQPDLNPPPCCTNAAAVDAAAAAAAAAACEATDLKAQSSGAGAPQERKD